MNPKPEDGKRETGDGLRGADEGLRGGPPGKGLCEGRWSRGRRRVGHSLFLKLLLVLLVAGVLVDLCVGGFFRLVLSRQAHQALELNLRHYADYLSGEIGSPPDTVRARSLAKAYSLQIRYEGPGGIWATMPGLEVLPRGNGHWQDDDGNIGWNRGRYYVQVERNGARYLFATDFRHAVGAHWPFVAALLCILSGILLGASLMIRRLLSPLKDLTAAVERLGNGELGHQVPDRCRQDELGDLGRAFNTMSKRLLEMVRTREQLLLDVSHELRSPLTRIKVALEMSPEGSAKDSIRDDLGEMEGMIGEILEAARLDSVAGKIHPVAVDLAVLTLDVAGGFEGMAPGVTVDTPRAGSAAEGTLGVMADPERVRKVLSNVIGNAVKYSKADKGAVEVSVEGRDGEVVVTVRDHGIGIPEAELPRLFEPFYRVDRSRSRDTGGYGLGLSLCKRIMEAHGGRIEIGSRIGDGTRVYLYFPRT